MQGDGDEQPLLFPPSSAVGLVLLVLCVYGCIQLTPTTTDGCRGLIPPPSAHMHLIAPSPMPIAAGTFVGTTKGRDWEQWRCSPKPFHGVSPFVYSKPSHTLPSVLGLGRGTAPSSAAAGRESPGWKSRRRKSQQDSKPGTALYPWGRRPVALCQAVVANAASLASLW